MVLVDDGVILGMHDRIKRLQHKMATMHREAQYQVRSFCAAVVAGTRVLASHSSWRQRITLYAVMDNSMTGESWQ